MKNPFQPDLLELIGMPENTVANKETVKVLCETVFPHYVQANFDDWLQENDGF